MTYDAWLTLRFTYKCMLLSLVNYVELHSFIFPYFNERFQTIFCGATCEQVVPSPTYSWRSVLPLDSYSRDPPSHIALTSRSSVSIPQKAQERREQRTQNFVLGHFWNENVRTTLLLNIVHKKRKSLGST